MRPLPSPLNVPLLLCVGMIATECLGELEPVAVEKTGETQGVEHVFLAQRITNERVRLLPEHCFFYGDSKKLILSGQTKSPETDPMTLNGGFAYSSIEGLNDPAHRVVWPLFLASEGELRGRVITKGRGDLSIKLGGAEAAVTIKGSEVHFKFERYPKGQVELSMSAKTFSGTIEGVELEGPALKDAKLLRARWRPAAIHSSFTASNLGKEQSRLWIMEVRPHQIEKDFYSPITTPFGYFGSTFHADGSSGGINFSMWSFEAGKAEPPLSELSHLLSVGSPQASFGGFNHEGTGVKLRGWNPYEGLKVASGALALRLDPGKPYDTYTGYYYDQTLARWCLFASGRKWSAQKSAQNLLPGCFVEVPGPPHIERSGHIPRTADFRGWCRDAKGIWHQLDTMIGAKADAAREQTNCLWRSSADNWFRMSIGGLVHFRYPKGVDVQIPKFSSLPAFLSPEKVKALDETPTSLRVHSAAIQAGSLVIDIELESVSKKPAHLSAYYGQTDALSFADRWEKKFDLGEVRPGKGRIKIPNVSKAGLLRIETKNETGIFFTADAVPFK